MLLGAPGSTEAPIPVEPPPDCPDRLWWVTRSLSEPDPARRPPTAAAARDALRAELPTWTAHDVEVFDQLPALPTGWAEDGPAERPAPVAPKPPETRRAERPGDTGATVRVVPWPAVLLAVAGVALILVAIALLAG
jgi:hypothetical protein